MHNKTVTADELRGLVGKDLEPSPWLSLDQERISAFAEVTEDRQFIHVDIEKAKNSPFGGTIAHGLLTLSMLPSMIEKTLPALEGMKASINYGYNKIRFLSPVRSGKKVRAKFVIAEFGETGPGRYQIITNITVEIEGEDKPALIAEWISIVLV
ncbi:MaoC family dehydratase [Pseudomonas sp. RGM2987]|uniref:MaoC family dehydratase n=1 Tax=Pseudomonas sp. RGM2987 TaxID=2930090 RepID=UPI001FD69CDA|nr:MaoC family dehydratase [Pseudomonas sp. RGM2987]MCJ8206418.1 MaoC family dehydratase [Pseudomonas sp. RGM2987]